MRLSPGCRCCHCTLSVEIFRDDACPAIGAHVVVKLGGSTVFEGDIEDLSGIVSWTGASPGVTYTIEWTYYDLSGSFTGACGLHELEIAAPSNLFTTCIEEPAAALYVTDVAGTRQVWPTSDCVVYNPGIPIRVQSGLSANGPCQGPTYVDGLFRISHVRYQDAGVGCSILIGPGGETDFTMPCERPWSYSGTYPANGPGLPFQIFGGTAFLIHE